MISQRITKDSKITGIDDLYETLENNHDFIMKWDYSPISEQVTTTHSGIKDVFKPGYTQAEEQKTFMTELSEKTTFIDGCRFIPMQGNEIDFNLENTNGKLYHMRQLNGARPVQVDDIRDRPEATPEFGRKILKAEPYFGRSFVNWLTIKENIMGERFVSYFQSDAIKQFKRFAERSLVYGINKMDAITQGTTDMDALDMMHCMDGLIRQLGYQRKVYDKVIGKKEANHNPMWMRTACGLVDEYAIGTSTTATDLVEYLKKVLTQYLIQGGDRNSAKFYMSAEMEAYLLTLQQGHEWERSGSIYFDKGTCYIWGVPCVHSETLDFPDGDYVAKDPKDQVSYIILGDLGGFVVGSKQDITTESKWDMFSQGYHAITKLYWGNLLLEPKKLIAVPVKGSPTCHEFLGTATGIEEGGSWFYHLDDDPTKYEKGKAGDGNTGGEEKP